ncbi:MAG: TIR domain-containing protein [Chlorobium sp.]
MFQEWDFHAGGNFVLEMHRAAKECSTRTLALLSQCYLNALFTSPEWSASFVRDPKGVERLLVSTLQELLP